MAKEQEQKPDARKKNEERAPSKAMQFAKAFFYVAPLVGILLGALYLMQEDKTAQRKDLEFSPGEFKSTVVRIIEKSQDKEGVVDMKKVEEEIEAAIKEKQPKEKK